MSTRSVSTRAMRELGNYLTILGMLLCACSGCSATDVSKIYVLTANHGCKVSTFSPSGEPLAPTFALHDFNCTGMVVDSEGSILVTLREPKGGLMKYSPDGQFVGRIIDAASASSVVLDAKGDFYLLLARSTQEWTVRKYTPQGTPAGVEFSFRLDNVPAIAVNGEGRICAPSKDNDVVRCFSPAGTIEPTAVKAGLNTPRAITIAPDGRIFTANFTNITIHKPDGQVAGKSISFVAPTSGGLASPSALTTGPDGKIYVGFYEGLVGVIGADGKGQGKPFKVEQEIRAVAVR